MLTLLSQYMGITVESIQAGDGKHYPSKRQTVTLHYVGYLDRAGEHKFDSTWDRGSLILLPASPPPPPLHSNVIFFLLTRPSLPFYRHSPLLLVSLPLFSPPCDRLPCRAHRPQDEETSRQALQVQDPLRAGCQGLGRRSFPAQPWREGEDHDDSRWGRAGGANGSDGVAADYAYGERGIPGLIPPNATLYLEVTLIAIH
mmetsp:Transcript_754/g.2252  ORF Transcript_754/g.2252 Transcript_754/m.2252 type:complete len:200 (-) Transcript_754:68-667(-)